MIIYASGQEALINQYIMAQAPERQGALNQLLQTISSKLPPGFELQMQYNMMGFVVPKSLYPKGYHCAPEEPLPFMHIANQKHFIAVYHMGIYANPELLEWFVSSYEALNIGKLDMGKSCIRFKKMDKIPYDLIGELATKISPESYIELYERAFRK